MVFAKAPVPGRVKSRLGRASGAVRAAALYRAFLAYLAAAWRSLPLDIRRFVAYDPPGAWGRLGRFFPWRERWLGFPQRGGNLGERLLEAGRRCRREGAEVTVVVGTDCLELHAARILRAFRALEERDVALVPAWDGGYVLIGWRGAPDWALFSGIPWSTDRVAEATLRRARRAGLTVAVLPALADVDEARDLPRLLARLDGRNPEADRVRRWAWECLRAARRRADSGRKERRS